MKSILAALLVGSAFMVQNVEAKWIVCQSTSGNIIEISNADVSRFREGGAESGDPLPGLSIFDALESNIAKSTIEGNPLGLVKCNPDEKTVVLRGQSDIDAFVAEKKFKADRQERQGLIMRKKKIEFEIGYSTSSPFNAAAQQELNDIDKKIETIEKKNQEPKI